MIILCAWCEAELSADPGPMDGKVSHGICCDCREFFLRNEEGEPFRDYLKRLNIPVIVVGGDGRIKGGTEAACGLLGKCPEELEGGFGGDAFECSYARLPGGCGNTYHCRTCTVRLMVTDTYRTGAPHYDVPAYLDVQTSCLADSLCLLISTEQSGSHVFLKIEEIRGIC